MNCPRCQSDNPSTASHCGKCGSALADEMLTGAGINAWSGPAVGVEVFTRKKETSAGELLADRYEILQLLGEGGMGAVYKAHDRTLDRTVALKVIRPELAAQSEVLARFKQELILARQITHKNVIRIYDLGESGGTRFITMEFIEGRDLKALLREKGKLPPADAAKLIQQVCRALAAAHAEGVIHRDLKPPNIMVGANGDVTVMDFGIARSMEAAELTRTGALMGTPEYMSPEQAMGLKLDTRSDLFSVGIILFECLTGVIPFKAENMVGTLLKRTQEAAPPVTQFDVSIPEDLAAVTAKCLGTKPEARYQDVREILRDLGSRQGSREGGATPAVGVAGLALSGQGTPLSTMAPTLTGATPAAGLPTPSDATTSRPNRSRLLMAGVAALLVVLAAGGYFFRGKIAPKPAPGSAVLVLVADFANTTGDPVFDGTLEPALTLALEGAAFITSFPAGEAHRIAAQIQPNATKIDESLGRLIATRQGIHFIVAGEIAKQGSGYRVSVKAVDAATGKVAATHQAEIGDKSALLNTVGKLAAPLRTAMGDQPPESLASASAETFTSASLEAAHEYAKGQELQWTGKVDEAIGHYEQAVKIDPEFGRAYAGLAAMKANQGDRAASEKYYQQAMARVQRMTERERFRTRGGYYLAVRNAPKAIEELSELVRQFPFDSAGRANLALAYSYTRNMQKALEECRKALEARPKSLLYRNNLALYAMYAGDYDTVKKEAGAVLAENPAYIKAYVALAIVQIAQGQLDQALETYKKLEAVNPRGASWAAMGMADLALYRGNAAEAVAVLQKAVAADLERKDLAAAAAKQIMLGEALLAQGQRGPAVRAAELALGNSTAEGTLLLAARILRGGGQEAKARSLAAQLSARLEPEAQAYGKLIEGELLTAKNDYAGALRVLREAEKLTDTWLGRVSLGQAYLQAKAYTEASSEFDLSRKRRGEATAVFLDEVPSMRYLPPLHYYQGLVQEGLKAGSGAESFRAFLQIREKAENDPLAADARKRLK